MMMTQMCCTCTICLLEINIGERVTHLTCGHMYYHPDCLGEWIIQKNSCPLCHDQYIAKEIRTCENVSNGITSDSSSRRRSRRSGTEEQGGIFHQWCGEAYARFVNIATGRNRNKTTRENEIISVCLNKLKVYK